VETLLHYFRKKVTQLGPKREKGGFTEHSSGGETTPLIQPIIRADGT